MYIHLHKCIYTHVNIHCNVHAQYLCTVMMCVCTCTCVLTFPACPPLWQDMVVEFAKMDAARLLEETEKAVSHLHILYMYIHYS